MQLQNLAVQDQGYLAHAEVCLQCVLGIIKSWTRCVAPYRILISQFKAILPSLFCFPVSTFGLPMFALTGNQLNPSPFVLVPRLWSLQHAADDRLPPTEPDDSGCDETASEGSETGSEVSEESEAGSSDESGSDNESCSDGRKPMVKWYIEGLLLLPELVGGGCRLADPGLFWEGQQVCRDAFIRLLGISRGRLARTRQNFRGQDMRSFSYLALACFIHSN